MTYDSDTDTWYCNTTWHSQCHMSHKWTWHM